MKRNLNNIQYFEDELNKYLVALNELSIEDGWKYFAEASAIEPFHSVYEQFTQLNEKIVNEDIITNNLIEAAFKKYDPNYYKKLEPSESQLNAAQALCPYVVNDPRYEEAINKLREYDEITRTTDVREAYAKNNIQYSSSSMISRCTFKQDMSEKDIKYFTDLALNFQRTVVAGYVTNILLDDGEKMKDFVEKYLEFIGPIPDTDSANYSMFEYPIWVPDEMPKSQYNLVPYVLPTILGSTELEYNPPELKETEYVKKETPAPKPKPAAVPKPAAAPAPAASTKPAEAPKPATTPAAAPKPAAAPTPVATPAAAPKPAAAPAAASADANERNMKLSFLLVQNGYPNLLKAIRAGNKVSFEGEIRKIDNGFKKCNIFDGSVEIPIEYEADDAFNEVKQIYSTQEEIKASLQSYKDCDKYITTCKFIDDKIRELIENPEEVVFSSADAKKLQRNLQTIQPIHKPYDDLAYLEDEKKEKVAEFYDIVCRLFETIDTILEISAKREDAVKFSRAYENMINQYEKGIPAANAKATVKKCADFDKDYEKMHNDKLFDSVSDLEPAKTVIERFETLRDKISSEGILENAEKDVRKDDLVAALKTILASFVRDSNVDSKYRQQFLDKLNEGEEFKEDEAVVATVNSFNENCTKFETRAREERKKKLVDETNSLIYKYTNSNKSNITFNIYNEFMKIIEQRKKIETQDGVIDTVTGFPVERTINEYSKEYMKQAEKRYKIEPLARDKLDKTARDYTPAAYFEDDLILSILLFKFGTSKFTGEPSSFDIKPKVNPDHVEALIKEFDMTMERNLFYEASYIVFLAKSFDPELAKQFSDRLGGSAVEIDFDFSIKKYQTYTVESLQKQLDTTKEFVALMPSLEDKVSASFKFLSFVLGLIDVARSHHFDDIDKQAVEILNSQKSFITQPLIEFGNDLITELNTFDKESEVLSVVLSDHIQILYTIKLILGGEYEPYEKAIEFASTCTSIEKPEKEQFDILKIAEDYLPTSSLVSLKVIYGLWNYFSFDEAIRNRCIKIIDECYAKFGRILHTRYLPLTYPKSKFIQHTPLFACDAKDKSFVSNINVYNDKVFNLTVAATLLEDCILEYCRHPTNLVNEITVSSMVKYIYVPASFGLSEVNRMRNAKNDLIPFAFKQVKDQPAEAVAVTDALEGAQRLLASHFSELIFGIISPDTFQVLSNYFLPFQLEYVINNDFDLNQLPEREELTSDEPERKFCEITIRDEKVYPFKKIIGLASHHIPDEIRLCELGEILKFYEEYINYYSRNSSYKTVEFYKENLLNYVGFLGIAENYVLKTIDHFYSDILSKFYSSYGPDYAYDWMVHKWRSYMGDENDNKKLWDQLADLHKRFVATIKATGAKMKQANDEKIRAENQICKEIHDFVDSKYLRSIKPDTKLNLHGTEFTAKIGIEEVVFNAINYKITVTVPYDAKYPYNPSIIKVYMTTPQITVKIHISVKDVVMKQFPQHAKYMEGCSGNCFYSAPYYSMGCSEILNESGGSITSGFMEKVIFSHIIDAFNNLGIIVERSHIEYLKEMERMRQEEKRMRKEMELRKLKEIFGV